MKQIILLLTLSLPLFSAGLRAQVEMAPDEEVAKLKAMIEASLAPVLSEQGYSIAHIELGDTEFGDFDLEYAFKKGNDYILGAYGLDNKPFAFELYRPAREQTNVFDGSTYTAERKTIQEGSGLATRNDPLIAEDVMLEAVHVTVPDDYDPTIVYLVIAYRSKDNDTNTAEGNLAEDHYIKE